MGTSKSWGSGGDGIKGLMGVGSGGEVVEGGVQVNFEQLSLTTILSKI